ncbi:DUF4335 domain-containing protein [Crocosphaera sp. XPORK-15E]|uniref:DUF4335 domain-containing protein n=1 Tax=Crocosphaera sp. XPORK-15E TaxID=3110247 RepID=UPI002B1FFD31|nr:DUF4335 domain-containing protein [Crocosphaera sp. XPORK-15E]MEA5532867.1 DUF4335 domain-containing protein [Crocosphaera sp. XPORK-15E]
MSVQRYYSLPNCTLILEGLGDSFAPADAQDSRPLLSILVNAECRFVGIPQALHGGRVFLENLVKVVSAYAQEYLSGIPHPVDLQTKEDLIRLEKIAGKHLHRLIWYPAQDNNNPVEITLTTVQLFDLVEGIDQFFADSRTLPDLTLQLQPVSRRYRPPDEPLAQRVVPATLGIVSVVLAAFAFYFIPIPEVREPEPKLPVTPTQPIPNSAPSNSTPPDQ